MIKGSGVALRAPRRDEHELLVQWRNENRQWFFNDASITLESHLEWYSGIKRDKKQNFFVIKAGRLLVGTIGLIHRNAIAAEYGRFLIAAPQRGNGYGSAALRALCQDAFDNLGIERIYGEMLSTNKVAIALTKKLGFSQVVGFNRIVCQSANYWRAVRMVVTAEDLKCSV